MKILKTTDLLKNHNDICLVPTMGALHDGHVSLIHKAKETGLKIVVSIFVNKLQFNDEQDFVNYPRNIENDIKILNDLEVDFAFIPDEETIYPKSGFENLYAGNLGNKYEGSSRPGHFDGVLTIVNRLFQLIRPHTVIFGSKDIQQLFLIKNLILNKKYDIRIIEQNTKRTKTGLALSSRNKLLTKEGMKKAENIFKALLTSIFSSTSGTADPVIIISSTVFNCAPRLPAGCNFLKSTFPNFLFCITAIASASPRAS